MNEIKDFFSGEDFQTIETNILKITNQQLKQLKTQVKNSKNTPHFLTTTNNIRDTAQASLGKEKAQQYLKNHETLNKSDFLKLFSGLNQIHQGKLGDCYLISAINILTRSQHFEPLIRSSLRIVKGGFVIKLPLGEPRGRQIPITNQELSIASIKGNTGYKLIELAYAKYITGSKTIDTTVLKKIAGGFVSKALKTILGINNIGYTRIGTRKKGYTKINTYTKKVQIPATAPYTPSEIIQINNTLKTYSLNRGTKFISASSHRGKSDQAFYTIEGKNIYHSHAYAVLGVEKDSKGEITRVRIQNPRNYDGKYGGGGGDFSLSFQNFLRAFPMLEIGNTTKNIFDNKTSRTDLMRADIRKSKKPQTPQKK